MDDSGSKWMKFEDPASSRHVHQCNECNGTRYRTRPQLRGDHAVADECERCTTTCPVCQGEGYVFDEREAGYQSVRECPVCGSLKRRIKLFNQAHIPSKYHDQDILSLKCYLDSGATRPVGNLPVVRGTVYNFVDRFMPGDNGYLLVGAVGTGKTHLLASTVRHLTLEKGLACRFIEFTHLLTELKVAFDRNDSAAEVVDQLAAIPVLAIDELGKGRKTDWELSIIDELISKRYNRRLSTLFTSNYAMTSPRKTTSSSTHRRVVNTEDPKFQRSYDTETLVDRLGASVVSRLHEMSNVVRFMDVPDYRRRDQEYY